MSISFKVLLMFSFLLALLNIVRQMGHELTPDSNDRSKHN
jgi:hypothetical protein